MSDDDAFLAAIIADPDNDMPRLVYADYLDEQGESDRAEFIRVQCELAQLDETDRRFKELTERQGQLLNIHHRSWAVPGFEGRQLFHRGFVEDIDLLAGVLIQEGRSLFEQTPIRVLRIRNATNHWPRLATIPGLRRIRHLDLSNSETFGNNRINDFLAQASLDSLIGLKLRNNQLWPEMLEVLAENPVIAQLTHLDLSGNPIQDRGAELLARHPSFANLKHLRLNSNDQRSEYCIHEAGINALANSHILIQLETLDLGGQYVGNEGFEALQDSANLTTLIELGLAYSQIGVPFDEALCRFGIENAGLPKLRSIDLRGNHINEESAKALVQSQRFQTGLTADLRECDIWASAWEMLHREFAVNGRVLLDEMPPFVE